MVRRRSNLEGVNPCRSILSPDQRRHRLPPPCPALPPAASGTLALIDGIERPPPMPTTKRTGMMEKTTDGIDAMIVLQREELTSRCGAQQVRVGAN
jgi:hypothetical protein